MGVSDNPLSSFLWEEAPDRTDMCGPGLRVAFTRHGPLWAHALLVPQADGLALMHSVDNDPNDNDANEVVENHRGRGPGGPR